MAPEPTTQPHEDPLVGRTVCGCEILGLISRGGMGKLYKARQLSLDRTVAVKVLSPALSANEEFLARFRREARSLANLLHPNIVAIHDFGEQADVHAIVMEYVEGESLADKLDVTNTLPLDLALDIVRQVAEGLACAHDKHIIHCDLKPENILVTPDGVAKVVDFGLAKSIRGDAMRVTQDGSILGTPTYMSPEQCEGAELDARTDIYSLGATFFRLVVGRDAFEGENAFAIMLKHQGESPPDPVKVNPALPQSLRDIILRMLRKRRDKRYQKASDVAEAIARVQAGETASQGTARVGDPRRELTIVRQAIESGLLTTHRLRQCLKAYEQADDTQSDLPTLLMKNGLLTEAQVERLAQQGKAREEVTGDEQFARLAIETGMATREQIAACLQRRKPRSGAAAETRLSKVLVREGVLQSQQVVELLLRQLKYAQEREDSEIVRLVRREHALSQTDIQRCVQEQERQETEGHPKLLRQIIIELGLMAPARLRQLLHRNVRENVENYLRGREEAEAGLAGPIMPEATQLKLHDTEPCPACGRPVRVGAAVCAACGRRVEDARREAARAGRAGPEPQPGPQHPRPAKPSRKPAPSKQPAGSWELRLRDGEPSRKLPFAALVKLARERRLKSSTVLRGPLTRGVWRQARHTPRLCRLFGTCHYCEAKLPPNAAKCPECGSDPDKPREE